MEVASSCYLEFQEAALMLILFAGVPPVKYPTSELIRRKNAGQPLEDSGEKEGPPRGKNSWPGKE